MKRRIIMSKFSKWILVQKTVKNSLVLFGPALLAFLVNVPSQYAWIAGTLAYALKNYLQNK